MSNVIKTQQKQNSQYRHRNWRASTINGFRFCRNMKFHILNQRNDNEKVIDSTNRIRNTGKAAKMRYITSERKKQFKPRFDLISFHLLQFCKRIQNAEGTTHFNVFGRVLWKHVSESTGNNSYVPQLQFLLLSLCKKSAVKYTAKHTHITCKCSSTPQKKQQQRASAFALTFIRTIIYLRAFFAVIRVNGQNGNANNSSCSKQQRNN